jgi:hypothetical protein
LHYLPLKLATCRASAQELFSRGICKVANSRKDRCRETTQKLDQATQLRCTHAWVGGVVAHTCNFSTWEAEMGDHKFKANLGYIVRPCLKKPRARNVAQWRV